MPVSSEHVDLGRLRLTSGEGRNLEPVTGLGPFTFGADTYAVEPNPVPTVLDVSRMTGGGLALRLRFTAALAGPCMRCLGPAAQSTDVDVREIKQPGGEGELDSPYVDDQDVLDLPAWARDAFLLVRPQQVLCRPDCAGLCPECGVDLNLEPDHAHERPPDPRWDALRELKLD